MTLYGDCDILFLADLNGGIILKAKKNLVWAAGLAAVCLICAAVILFWRIGENNPTAEIYSGGELVRTVDDLSPDEEYSFRVDCGDGYNIVTVGGGEIWVSEADCSNQTCVNAGKISGGGQTIICAPHKLVIRITSGSGADAVA